MKRENEVKCKLIQSDILILMRSLERINWNPINIMNLNRIIYYALITNEFIMDFTNEFRLIDEHGNYSYYYSFEPKASGPISKSIEDEVLKLKNSNVIRQNMDGSYTIVDNINWDRIPYTQNKDELFTTLSKVLIYYGEFEIYDLLFKDVNFRLFYDSNDQQIQLEKNRTAELLLDLKEKFDEKNKGSHLDKISYIRMYFDFAFSQIIRERGDN